MFRMIALILLSMSAALPVLAESIAMTPVRLALNWKPEPQFGGFYQAEANAFPKRGLAVTILEGGSGTPTVQMLANKQVDVAIVSAEEILISNERNPRSRVIGVFAVYQTNPQMIMCRQDRNLKTLGDVFTVPGTVAMQSGLTYAQFLKKKYPKGQAKIVPYTGGIANFLAQKDHCQQGFATSEPLAAEKAGATPKVYLVADEGFNPYTTVVAVREEDYKKKPDQVKRLVEAVREGWGEYLKDPTSANAQMHKLNPSMDLETFRRSAEAQKELIQTAETQSKGLGVMTTERWAELGKQLREFKVLRKEAKASDQFVSP